MITAEEAILPHRSSEVANGRPVIAPLGSFTTSFGSGTMAIEELTAIELAVLLDDSSDLELAGQADLQQIEMGGSAADQTEDLQRRQAFITAGGSAARSPVPPWPPVGPT